jgi:hypothetical protein
MSYTYERPAPVELPSMRPVVELLDKARASGLQFPKLWLQFGAAKPLRIVVAGERSRTPGYLMLTDGGPFGANQYYGRISPQGKFELGRDLGDNRADVVGLLIRLCDDPAAVAAAFGHLTGNCCFCSRKLSDARSIETGYGRGCADRFGLPWGKR